MAGSDINNREFTVVGELSGDGTQIVLTHYKAIKRLVAHLKGHKLEVTFKKLRYNRSDSQNRYLWGVVYVTISAWYYETHGERISKDAIHAHTLQYILGYEPVVENIYGREVIVMEGKSTSKLNTVEFNDMVEKLHKYWAEKGCYIPEPRENNFITDYLKDE